MSTMSELDVRLKDAKTEAQARRITGQFHAEIDRGKLPSASEGIELDPYWLGKILWGDVDGLQISAPGPGHSDFDRSIGVTVGSQFPEGYLVHSFSPRTTDLESFLYVEDCIRKELEKIIADWQRDNRSIEEIMELWSSGEPKKPESTPQAKVQQKTGEKDKHKNFQIACRIWKNADTELGPEGEDYIRSRGLNVPPDCIGRVFRYGPASRWKLAGQIIYTPMLIAVTRDIVTDAGYAIHRTRLPHLGKGPERLWLGSPFECAIKLTPHEDVRQWLDVAA